MIRPTPLSRRLRRALLPVALLVVLPGADAGWAAQPAPGGTGAPGAGTGAPGAGAGSPGAVPRDDATRGLRYAGLRRSALSELCRGAFEIRLAAGAACTHGPDPAPPGVDVRSDRAAPVPAEAAEAALAASAPPCQGDGMSGPRVQLVYARAAGVADRYATMLPSFHTWAARLNDVFNLSAAETGGTRHVRFVHDASCVPSVLNVTLSAAGDDSLTNTINELRGQGYNRSDRKYLVWMDANVYCGIAQIYSDDRKIASNYNNGPSGVAGMVGRVDAGCWGHSNLVEAHELVHLLGGVQTSAPNATPYNHCTDDYDRMCYSDGSGVTRVVCTNTVSEGRLDCNHDDYFSTSPAAGNYLATHWNVADSAFLSAGGTPPTTVPPPTTSTTTTTKPPATTTTTKPPATTTTTKPPATTTTTLPGKTRIGRYIDRIYLDLLGRSPTAFESAFWVSGGHSRATVANALTTSPEYRQRVVNANYLTLLGRNASPGELDALVGAIAGGWLFEYVQTLVFGGGEFYARHGSSAGAYVDALYAYLLGAAPDEAGRAFWVDQIVNRGLDRYTVALAFCTYTGTLQRLVGAAYQWLLGRAPNAAELSTWTAHLDGGTRQEAFFATLAASDEYWSRV